MPSGEGVRAESALGDGGTEVPPSLAVRAEALAAEAHRGQMDKCGEPYIGHLERVAGRVRAAGADEATIAAAWLHDVVEDTAWTADELREAGFPADVVDAVVAVTKVEGERLADYADRIRENPRAVQVKRADLADNTDPQRTAGLSEPTRARLAAKYEEMARLLPAE